MEKRSHFREAQSFAGRTFGSPLSESNSASLGICTCFAIVRVTAAVFHVKVLQCPQLPDQLVFARTWPLSRYGWFLHVLGHCPGQLSCVSFAYVTLPPGRACEANDHRSAQRSVRSVGISDRSVGDLRSTGRKL